MAEEKARNKIDHLSASQINLYLQCGLKYKFQYIDRLPRPFKPSGLAFGSVIHSTLEWFHKERLRGNAHSLEKLIKVFETDWFSQTVETEIRYKNGEAEKDLLIIGRQMLTQYFHSNHLRPVAAEVPFNLPLIEPFTGEVLRPTLEGVIDLVETGHVLVEFKTSAKTMNSDDLQDSHQLTCYAYAYEMLFQARPKVIKVLDFVKTKTPKIVPFETRRGKRDFQRLFHIAKEMLNGISSGVFIPKASFMCKDCEYEGPCKEWKGNDIE
ncbi:MAG: PD-(D/E)XK nuclease family protein [Deltaproteobacteria bacterium]|nr:PD-(D/E)XK nuclease family protein [Deltaproteobacteria bacterium]